MKKDKRYELLDILRGFAALSVVMWHWKHFYFSPTSGLIDNFDKTQQPFYKFIYPLYNFGGIAVDWFFLISGFIFYSLYSKKISYGLVTPFYFFILRFSRLYPLHIITLITVAFLQILYTNHFQQFFVYQHNDLYHFALNVFFASSWGIENGESFNGPIWSVSVEIILYSLFFIMCNFRLHKARWAFAVVIASLLLPSNIAPLSRGFLSFFLGGICFSIIDNKITIKNKSYSLLFFSCLLLISITLLLASPLWVLISNFIEQIMENKNIILPLSAFRIAYLKSIVFPLLLIVISLLDDHLSKYVSPIKWIGNITYSSYLLHFPLQLAFVLFAAYTNRPINFYSETTFSIFFLSLIIMSLFSYYKVELPLQKYIRSFEKSDARKTPLVTGKPNENSF